MNDQTTQIIITRHGETQWNTAAIHQGQLDSTLTPLGISQATALAAALTGVNCAALYASDLGRTMHTAKIIAAAVQLEIIPEAGLREINYGILQGKTLAEFASMYPEHYAAHLRRDPEFALPGAESYRQFYERTIQCFNQLAAKHPGQTILVVTHGGNLGCLFRAAFELPLTSPRQFSLRNVSYNRFTVTDGRWRLETWGDISHLQRLQAQDEL